jgi:hypothetical protein
LECGGRAQRRHRFSQLSETEGHLPPDSLSERTPKPLHDYGRRSSSTKCSRRSVASKNATKCVRRALPTLRRLHFVPHFVGYASSHTSSVTPRRSSGCQHFVHSLRRLHSRASGQPCYHWRPCLVTPSASGAEKERGNSRFPALGFDSFLLYLIKICMPAGGRVIGADRAMNGWLLRSVARTATQSEFTLPKRPKRIASVFCPPA